MKKFLLSLFLSFVGFISFCSAIYFSEGNGNRYGSSSIGVNAGASANIGPAWNGELLSYGTFCITYNRGECTYNGNTYSTNGSNKTLCFFNDSSSTVNFSVSCTNTYTSKAYYYIFSSTELSGSLFECEECEECQECPIIDSQYCIDNNLCPINDGSGSCEEGDGNWSALYINNIQHQSAPLINIDIPDYIYWDYTSSEEEFDLYVGSGYDQDYIDSVISVQSYQPTSQDFTDVFVGGLTLIFPYIVIVLFIVFVWKLLKRIFK